MTKVCLSETKFSYLKSYRYYNRKNEDIQSFKIK